MPTLPIYTRTSQQKNPQQCPHLPTIATHPYDVYTLTARLPTLLSGLILPPTRYLSLPTPALLTADPLVPVSPYSQHSARSRTTRSRYGRSLSYLIVYSLAVAKIPSNLQSYNPTHAIKPLYRQQNNKFEYLIISTVHIWAQMADPSSPWMVIPISSPRPPFPLLH